MRRQLIPIFTLSIAAAAMASTEAAVPLSGSVTHYCRWEYDGDIWLDPDPCPGEDGWGSTWLGIHCNGRSTVRAHGSGIFEDRHWSCRIMLLHGDQDVTGVTGGIEGGTDDDATDRRWSLRVWARPDYSVPPGDLPESWVTLTVTVD